MWIIWMLLVGLIVGALAKVVMPGKDPGGFFVTSLIGIAGALIAGFLGQQMGFYLPNEPAGFFASVVGAVILLAVYRMVKGKA